MIKMDNDIIINADDVVARLKEEIKKLEAELIKFGTHEIGDLKRRELSHKLIAYNRILYGDKPIDKC